MDQITRNISPTELTKKLDECWESMEEFKRNGSPAILECIKSVFRKNNINEKSQLPRTDNDIVMLMKEIPTDSLVPEIFEKAFEIKVPKLNIPLLVGHCYNIITGCTTLSIFDLGDSDTLSPIGYLMPSGIKCDLCSETKVVCEYFRSRDEYIKYRLRDLNIHQSVDVNKLKWGTDGQTVMGYNIFDTDTAYGSPAKITLFLEFRKFQLTLVSNIDLNHDFKSAVEDLPEFDEKSNESVDKFKNFFQTFGTHVVTSCFGGGAIEVEVPSPDEMQRISDSNKYDFFMKTKANLMKTIDLHWNFIPIPMGEINSPSVLESTNYSIHCRGGDMKNHVQTISEHPSLGGHEKMAKWIESLATQPLMLQTNMTLVPVSYYVRETYPQKEKHFNRAYQQLLEANLEYVPRPSSDPPLRANVEPPQEPSGSCLKAGTLILLSDGRKLPIEMIHSGDTVMDINLKPCKVIGINHMLMDGKGFYGFSKNNCFFTGGHIFAQNNCNEFFVVSKQELLKDNPFIDELNVVEVQPGHSVEVMKIRNDIGMKDTNVICERVRIFKDETEHDAEVPAYFLIVENETGTYIANDYVCRHELPRFERWPNTLICLQKVFTSDAVKRKPVVEKLSPSAIREMERIVNYIAKQLEKEFPSTSDAVFNDVTNIDHGSVSNEYLMTDFSLYLATLTEILQDNYWSAFAMLIYARCGNLIRDVLDKQRHKTVSSSALADFIITSIKTFYQ